MAYQPIRIPAEKIKPLVEELTLRCGSPELAAEYAGLGKSTLYRIRNDYHREVNSETARLIILALYQRRKEDRRNGSSKAFLDAKRYQAKREKQLLKLEGY